MKTINIGELDIVEAVFRARTDPPETHHLYLLQAPGAATGTLDVLTRFPKDHVKTTAEYYIDDTDGQWFAFFNVDCFDPPMAIIRARSFESAYEVFCDEFERWLKVESPDSDDYPEDERTYNGSGTHIDTDCVHGVELVLIRAVTEIGGK